MKLLDRVEKLERRLNHAHFDGNGGWPVVIRILGGIDAEEPMRATIGPLTIECDSSETVDAFEDRAIRVAIAHDARFVILGGLPRLDPMGEDYTTRTGCTAHGE